MDFLKINNLLEPVLEQLRVSAVSADEKELLKGRFWDAGEDIRLREDWRFRQTPWGKWTTAASYLANDEIFSALRDQATEPIELPEALQDLQKTRGYHCVFCPADPRMVMQNDLVRLAAAELSDEPLVEDNPGDLAKFTTHLPVHTLRAVAASEPIGEWGPCAQEQHIETLGWVKVEGRTLNERMFVARIEGHSMEGDKRGIEAGKYAIFELWPAGKREDKILLLRGAFNDPETGFYVIKQYFPETRDENRERRQIRLVSTNNDKERYPDIVITEEKEDDIKVVAQFLTMLDRLDYAREPKRLPRRGFRDLDNQASIKDSLDRKISSFFAAEPLNRDDADEDSLVTEEPSGDHPQLVCFDWLSGGLHLKLPALKFLPSFVRRIELVAGSSRQAMLAGNLKARENLVPVAPETEGYRLEAPGFDEVKEELDALTFKPLTTAEPLFFAVDADNIGRRLKGSVLSPGRQYRLILPPGQQNLPATTDCYQNGWAQVEFVFKPDLMPTWLNELLSSLNFAAGTEAISTLWCDEIPTIWKKNAAGESYPCFSTGQHPVLLVSGCETAAGEMSAYLSGPGINEQIRRPAGVEWRIRISELPAGQYGLKILHRRTRFTPLHVFFAVDDAPPALPEFQITLWQDEKAMPLSELNQGTQPDLTARLNGTDSSTLLLQGPPCWPLAVHWSEDRRRHSIYQHFSDAGFFDLGEQIARLGHYLANTPLGELIIDVGELGAARITYRRWKHPEARIAALKKEIAEKSPMLPAIVADPARLLHFFIMPLLNILGIRCLAMANQEIDGIKAASSHALYTLRLQKDRVSRVDYAMLLLVPNLKDVDIKNAQLAARMAALGNEFSFDRIILVDGSNWLLFNCNANLFGDCYNLPQVFGANADDRQKQFLNDFTGA